MLIVTYCPGINGRHAMIEIKRGLEGVVVDNTATSFVDGDAGTLYYRGYPIEELVKYPFAAVAYTMSSSVY